MNTHGTALMAVILCAGCASQSARQVATLPDYHATQDYRLMENVFDSMDAIAKGALQLGMSPVEVRQRMGKPELDQSEEQSRVQIWTYLVSISGTWTYSLVFLDGQLEHFGRLNPQWLDMASYASDFPEIRRIHAAIVAERKADRDRDAPSGAPLPHH